MAKPSKVSKFFRTLLVVLLVLIILITVVINVAFLKTSNAPELFGTSIYIMQQDNMKEVHQGDAVISSSKEIENLKVGNTVLCLTSPANDFKEVLKLINITQEDGATYYYVRADKETDADALKLTEDKIIAKCLMTNSSLGKAIGFAKTTVGIIVLVLVPCAILLIMKITSDLSERAEEKKEEELIKSKKNDTNNSKKSNKNVKHKPDNNSNSVSKEKITQHKSKKDTNFDDIEVPKRTANKQISVKTLSEEESIKQRENVSNMVGSELEKNTSDAKTRAFDSTDVKVSSMKNVDAIKIFEEEDNSTDETVHSPNMLEKANKIKQNLSNAHQYQDDETKPVMAKTSNVEEPSKEVPTPKDKEPIKTEPSKTITSESSTIEDAVVIMPTNDDTNKDIKLEKVSTGETTKIENTIFNEDDFLKDIIGNDEFTSTNINNKKVSNDVLDQLLDSIPSTHPTEKTKKVTPQVTSKPRKPKTKPVHHTTKTIKTPKITNKIVDNTSFDELIKAIEKEKNSMK